MEIYDIFELILGFISVGFFLLYFSLVIFYCIGYSYQGRIFYEKERQSIIDHYGTDDLDKFTPKMLKNLQENVDKFPRFGKSALQYEQIAVPEEKRDPPHRMAQALSLSGLRRI
jgi:hypothetical protein